MNKPLKILWSLRNTLHAFYLQYFNKGNSGLLTNRDNGKDLPYLGGAVEPKFKELSLIHNPDWIFDQNPFNICTFTSEAMGDSHQEKKRFSTKFLVKVGRKLGYISGNGFSYLKAPLKIVTKYGRLPYELMPDETDGQSWEEYSKWDVTTEQLNIALKYKSPAYRRIFNPQQAIHALEQGLVLHTANVWYSNMNNVKPPDFYITVGGYKIGGHAWSSTGYRRNDKYLKDYEILNSYGKDYGVDGLARMEDLFNYNNFAVYVAEKISEVTNPFNVRFIQEQKAKGKKYILLVENYKEYTRGLWEIQEDKLVKIEAKDLPEKERNNAFIVKSAEEGNLVPYSSLDFSKFII